MTTTTSRNDLLSGTGHAWRDAAEQDEQLARLVWAHIAEPRDAKAQLLVDGVGYPEALAAVRTHPEKLANFAARLEQLDLPEQLRRIETFGARILLPSDDGWPERLDDLPQPPHYGQRVAAEIALGVGSHGVAVVSGGAFGIDAAAHRGALAGDAGTVCVLPGGVDRLYPSAHDALFSAIRERGAIVSEMPLGFAPMRQRFLHRNRLIAALTPGTVVVEAGLRSGSLSTARRAEEIQRVVGAVPGPVTSAASAGCHELVRDGAAVLVTGADDVIELMAGYGAQQTTRDTLPALVKPEDAVGATARAVWDALPVRRAASVDHVATSCGRTPREVLTALGELLAAGLAEKVDGAWRKA